MEIGDLDGDSIQRADFKDKDLEKLLRRLLKSERSLRHREDAEILGPVAAYRGDELRDLIFTPKGAPKTPRERFTAALTWDQPGTPTWYSCKGGGSWRSSILGELGQAERNKALKENRSPSDKVRKRPPATLLDHLEQGGRYAFVVGVPTIENGAFLKEVRDLLAFWLEHEARSIPAALLGQLAFIDAHGLADFIGTHHPNLTEDQRTRLGLSEPRGLKVWSHWTDELAGDRDLPEFQADRTREKFFEAVKKRDVRVLRVFGPPGVGKTRVVHEAIARCGDDAQQKVRYCDDVKAGLEALEGPWLREGAKPWVVLDEVRTLDIERLTSKFLANSKANESARLFLVGTADSDTATIPGEQFALSALDESATRTLIANEAPQLSKPQREAVWRLSEGYPWYAVLLARAISTDEDVLESGDDEATRWSSGALRVLAGNQNEYSDAARWRREAELRAKTLLVAMLTRDLELDWDTLWERHGEGLRLAIDEPTEWEKVRKLEVECRGRQLLRRSGLHANRRYVSPNNLARLILNHFLTDPDLGPRIRRNTPHLRKTLVDIAKAVRVQSPLIERLAKGEWDELERRAAAEGTEAVENYVRLASAVYGAAQDDPERAADTMSRIVSSLGSDDLRETPNLRAVATHVFEHLIHRRIAPSAFLRVEASLLVVARVDDSPFSNNAAGVWSSVFLPVLHLTHQSWDFRLERLDERLVDRDVFVRRLAINALGPAVDPGERGLGHSDSDRVDGKWPVPSVPEAMRRKEELWSRLLDACGDSEPDLASQARTLVANQFRGAVGRGLYAESLERLTSAANTWSPSQRLALMESITDLRRYDSDDLAKLPELVDAVGQLEAALQPRSVEDRVRAQIGSWHPGHLHINDPERERTDAAVDLELAHELIEAPRLLDWAIHWSSTEQAPRAPQLWTALGRADRGDAVLERLASDSSRENGADILGRYLLGWAEASSAEVVEEWIWSGPWRDRPTLRLAAMKFLVLQAPTVRRLDKLRALIKLGTVDKHALVFLPFRGWDRLAPTNVVDFLEVALRTGELSEVVLRCSLQMLRGDVELGTARSTARALLVMALRQALETRVVIPLQDAVTDAACLLADEGDYELVAQLVLSALSDEADTGKNTHLGQAMLSALLRAGHADALWPTLAQSLLHQHGRSLFWSLGREHLLAFVTDSVVLDWVGNDRNRGWAVAGLTSPHGPDLGDVVVELLERFGAESSVARGLESRAHTTPRAIHGGMESFYELQRDNARSWQRAARPQVKAWAKRLEDDFDAQLREEHARREHKTRYGS